MWLVVPLPAWPMLTVPGLALASATTAFMSAKRLPSALGEADPSPTISATLYDNLNFSFIPYIAPVSLVLRSPFVIVVNPGIPAKTIAEFITYAKANPGKVNMGSAGTGSTQHVAGELFKMMVALDMVHIPHRGGGPALTDLIAGQVQVLFLPSAISIELIRAGRLRALAVTTANRFEALPDIPSVHEFVADYEASTWLGVCAPPEHTYRIGANGLAIDRLSLIGPPRGKNTLKLPITYGVQLSRRADRAALGPGPHQRAELGLRAGRGRALAAGRPRPADQSVLAQVAQQSRHVGVRHFASSP